MLPPIFTYVMEMILFIGIQATGKSTFYRERFADTHVRLNLDMLKTRHREKLLMEACLYAKQPFVVDNTNVTKGGRKRYIEWAREHQFAIHGYYFRSVISEALPRNEARVGKARVPMPGVLGTAKRLELPVFEEGFDTLHYVQFDAEGGFIVEEWMPR